MRVRSQALWLCLLSGAALAHDVGAELSLGGNQASPQNPRNGYAGALVSGGYDVNDWFGLSASAGLTHDNATANSDRRVGGNNIFAFAFATDFLLLDHLLLNLGVNYSPRSVQQQATTFTVGNLTTDVTLDSANSLFGGQVALAYHSNGLSRVEHGLLGIAQVTRFGLHVAPAMVGMRSRSAA